MTGRFLTRVQRDALGNANSFAGNNPWSKTRGKTLTIGGVDYTITGHSAEAHGHLDYLKVVGDPATSPTRGNVHLHTYWNAQHPSEHEVGHWFGLYYPSVQANGVSFKVNDIKALVISQAGGASPASSGWYRTKPHVAPGNIKPWSLSGVVRHEMAHEGGMFFGNGTAHQSGQATGKRQHMPIRIRTYYDQGQDNDYDYAMITLDRNAPVAHPDFLWWPTSGPSASGQIDLFVRDSGGAVYTKSGWTGWSEFYR
jgi:hypothetical protein